jgi:hypothetical protein
MRKLNQVTGYKLSTPKLSCINFFIKNIYSDLSGRTAEASAGHGLRGRPNIPVRPHEPRRRAPHPPQRPPRPRPRPRPRCGPGPAPPQLPAPLVPGLPRPLPAPGDQREPGADQLSRVQPATQPARHPPAACRAAAHAQARGAGAERRLASQPDCRSCPAPDAVMLLLPMAVPAAQR